MLACAAVVALLMSSGASAGSIGDAGLGLARAGSTAAAAAGSSAAPTNSSSGGSSGLFGGLDLGPWQRLWASPDQRAAKPKAEVLAELKAENAWKNSLVTWMLPQAVLERMPFVVQVLVGGEKEGGGGGAWAATRLLLRRHVSPRALHCRTSTHKAAPWALAPLPL